MAQVAATFTADISGYLAAMTRMANSTKAATESSSSFGSKVSSAMSTVGKATIAAGAATTAMGVSALKSYGTFQQSLNKAAIIAGGTSKDIGELADMANRMGAELPLSAQDAADAMVAMAQDGASIKTITKEFPAIAEAATATGADLQTTAGTVQQSMNIWGDSLKSPSRAAAILTQTANLSNASIEDMSGAIANIGGVAKNAGYGMGDMTESIGLLTNRGFTAQRASQDLAHAIIAIQAPSDKAQGVISDLGLKFTDASGKMKPFPQILSDISKATDGMSQSQKVAALKTMVGTAGMQALLPLLDSVNDKTGNTATSWDAYAKAQDKASSSAAVSNKFLSDQASEMQKNIGSKIEQIGGNWESLRNKSLAAKGGVNSAMIDMINQTITWATDSNSSIAKVARGFIGLSPVIGPAVTATGGFITAAGKISGVAIGAAKGLLGLGKSIIGMPARLLGIGSASKKATESVAPLEKATRTSANAAASSAANFLTMGAAIALIGAGVLAASAGIAILVQSAINLAQAGSGAQIAMAALAVGIVALGGAFALLGPALTANAVGIGVFGAAVLAVGVGVAAFGLGVNQVSQAIVMLSGKMSSIVPVFSALGRGFAAMLTSFLTGILTAAPAITAAFIGMIAALLAQLSDAAPKMVTSFIGIITGMMTAISTHGPALVTSFATMVISLVTALTAQIGPIVAAFTSMIVAMLTAIATNAPVLIASFTAMIVSLINSLTAAIPSLVAAGVGFVVALIGAIGSQAPALLAAGIALVGQLAQAFVVEMPLLIQIAGATLAAVIAVLATYAGQMTAIGGILLHALAAGFTGQKYDAIGAATDVIQSSGAAASVAGQSAFKAAGGDAAIQSAQAIANSKGNHQSAGVAVGKAGAAGVSSTTGSFTSAGGSVGNAAASGINGKSGSARASGSSLGQSGASGIKSTSGYFTGAGTSIGSAAASGLNGQKGHANSVGRDLGSSSANAVKDGTSGVDLYSNGDSLMGGFLSGLRDKYSAVQSFVSGIAGWIKAHKGPISYDAKLLIPAGNAMMNGLNSGLMNSFSTVQHNVSGMADKLSESINSVAGDIKTGDLSMQAASYQGGSIDQNIDTNNWVKPTYVVHNELVGDKIRTIVSQGQADDQVSSKFFMS